MFSKKIILSLMMVVLLTFTDISSARAFTGGDGSSGNPYQITNSVELQEMKNNPNSYYILINDIDCSDTVNWNSGAGFEPIYGFTGTFDGQGYKITGLFINRPFALGLFGTTGSGAIIKNVGLEDIKITGSGYPGGSNYIGGLIGESYGGTIINSYVTGSVKGDLRIGGLVGENWGTITNSYATASVTGLGYQVGGLTGSNYGAITNCYATGKVTASYLVGGLVGANYGGTITNSYWDIETSGQSTSAGGIGKTTAEMKTQSTYTNWDFINIWAIKEGVSYPYLQWQTRGVIGVHVGDRFHYRVSYSAQGAPGVWPYITGKADLLATLEVVDITGTTITFDETANYLNGKIIHFTGYEYMSPTSPVEILILEGLPVTIFPANIKAGQWKEMFHRESGEEPVVTFTVTTSKLHGQIVDIIDMSAGTQSVYWEWYQDTGVPICIKTVTSTFTCTIALIGSANK